ncbi:MAG: hypothetical protein UV61_C0008G0119 [Candidatus Gottesmanbacteria bacterium GW2011_GWB1_43_11]|uniref:Uncharacterized protein n=1 Tax=Candidatus Gottesmanbacteria bacterium GW2011_GWB1_43_11 TaxID=1618446 RepID=A0A0G1EUG4_9BACT|nr:MAG: hypothetical protein UV04_C0009G0048 [Candidatus Gottesmanbacteria bacterium GW2011_GWA2_42_16]KKS54961.1 MAG: hypothetical protein UV17_C0014G0044 [Candidatus Gottesmanbacteria bacterium GW2011_GWA1_42_26]KKS80456.1 MAG: hypothetical protein UV55_C0038G0003 [Candidatus Gottesmanbacteria bacterium GW2011_GWC1_43_10]KKS86666.1 MAG: hypothetical protein UV61_C0008G0119 [Candidatus Gottesmanbacteria bacterium GW2011_GWB1_43_11]OGG10549.1 MAG: hypothetical protein A2699_06305 [Candidatus Go
MTSISHALIGAAIAAKITDPVTAGTLAFITHFVCDAIPHWDWGTNWRKRPRAVTGTLAVSETLIALFGTYFIFNSLVPSSSTLTITVLLSLLPDWLEAPYYLLLPHPPKFFYYMYRFQSFVHERLQAPWGILTQTAVVMAFLYVGFRT